jgi:hypothetical protein
MGADLFSLSVNDEITRILSSPNSVFKKVPILEKLNPDMDYVACEEEQLSQHALF